MSRAIRRHHKSRMKAKARAIVKIWNASSGVKLPIDKLEAHADHLKACSCYMCGNPRRHFGSSTIQELKWNPDIKYTSTGMCE